MRETEETILRLLKDGKEHQYTEVWRATGRSNKVTWTNLEGLIEGGFVGKPARGSYKVTKKGLEALARVPPPGFRELLDSAVLAHRYLDSLELHDERGEKTDVKEAGVSFAMAVGHLNFVIAFLREVSDIYDIDLGKREPFAADVLHGPLDQDSFFVDVNDLIETATRFRRLNHGDERMEEVGRVVIEYAREARTSLERMASLLKGKRWAIEPPFPSSPAGREKG